MRKVVKKLAKAVLAAILMGSLVLFLSAPSLLVSGALLGAMALSGYGLQKLGTFNEA